MAGIADLIENVQAATGIAKKDVDAVVRSVFTEIDAATNNGELITIRGFGSFKNKTRSARTGRNPQSGVAIQIPEKTVLSFKASK